MASDTTSLASIRSHNRINPCTTSDDATVSAKTDQETQNRLTWPFSTLHWALIILTEQAFLNRGHFTFTLEPRMEEISRQRCIQAALNIWKLVDAYRRTFTLRRAQYGISYATYCAVLVMLQHTRHDNHEYNECIRFFWSALWEYQRGCNQGLKRPLRLLRSLMRRLKRTMEDLDAEEENGANRLPTTGNVPFNHASLFCT